MINTTVILLGLRGPLKESLREVKLQFLICHSQTIYKHQKDLKAGVDKRCPKKCPMVICSLNLFHRCNSKCVKCVSVSMYYHSRTTKTSFTLGLDCLRHIYRHQDNFENSPRGPFLGKKKTSIKEKRKIKFWIGTERTAPKWNGYLNFSKWGPNGRVSPC